MGEEGFILVPSILCSLIYRKAFCLTNFYFSRNCLLPCQPPWSLCHRFPRIHPKWVLGKEKALSDNLLLQHWFLYRLQSGWFHSFLGSLHLKSSPNLYFVESCFKEHTKIQNCFIRVTLETKNPLNFIEAIIHWQRWASYSQLTAVNLACNHELSVFGNATDSHTPTFRST